MSIISRVRSAARRVLLKREAELELDLEIREYIDGLAEQKVQRGAAPPEARRQALAESGCLEQVKQAVRDQRVGTDWSGYGRTCDLDCGNWVVRPASRARDC